MNNRWLAPLAVLLSVTCAAIAIGLALGNPTFDPSSSYQEILAARGDPLLPFRIPFAIVAWAGSALGVAMLLGCLVVRRSRGVGIQLVVAFLFAVGSGVVLLWRA